MFDIMEEKMSVKASLLNFMPKLGPYDIIDPISFSHIFAKLTTVFSNMCPYSLECGLHLSCQ